MNSYINKIRIYKNEFDSVKHDLSHQYILYLIKFQLAFMILILLIQLILILFMYFLYYLISFMMFLIPIY
jgi:hypothetical protein